MDENHFSCYDIACGFGFTLFAVKENYKYSVYGTGINTDSQLGLHEFPRKSGKAKMKYVSGSCFMPKKFGASR